MGQKDLIFGTEYFIKAIQFWDKNITKKKDVIKPFLWWADKRGAKVCVRREEWNIPCTGHEVEDWLFFFRNTGSAC